jgi:PKHD-type hydroxylase
VSLNVETVLGSYSRLACCTDREMSKAILLLLSGQAHWRLKVFVAREISSYNEWMSFIGFVSVKDCSRIVDVSNTYEARKGETVGEEREPGRRQVIVRRLPRDENTAWLYEIILDLAIQANNRYFGLDVTEIIKQPEYLEYPAGCGRFDWHNDYTHDSPVSSRKLTVSIQLNEPREYKGGELELFDAKRSIMPRERGSVTIFPSFYYHRVRPVKEGTRKALVAWIAGATLR